MQAAAENWPAQTSEKERIVFRCFAPGTRSRKRKLLQGQTLTGASESNLSRCAGPVSERVIDPTLGPTLARCPCPLPRERMEWWGAC